MAQCFTVLKKCPHTAARRGELVTAHGKIQTPIFMTVARVPTNRFGKETKSDRITEDVL